MLKISEWNSVVEHGNKVCEELKGYGYNTKLKPYTMYDGRQGLFIQVFDGFGQFYTEYASGIWNSVEEFKSALDNCAKIIRENC